MWEALIQLVNKWSCMHQWHNILEKRVESIYGERFTSITYCCKKCGKFKKVKSS